MGEGQEFTLALSGRGGFTPAGKDRRGAQTGQEPRPYLDTRGLWEDVAVIGECLSEGGAQFGTDCVTGSAGLVQARLLLKY